MSENETGTINRRTLLKSAGGLAALTLVPTAYSAPSSRRRYVIVGVGSRARMYLTAIAETFPENNELVAVCDTNPGRLPLAAKVVTDAGRKAPKTYAAADFDRMLRETKPYGVIVTTPCAT